MNKRDLKLGLLIGFLIGLLALPVLGNLDLAISFYYFLFLPVILPFLVVAGLLVADWLGQKIKIIKQIARFVLVGALNTFIDFGIIGLLLWVSGIDAVRAIGIYAFLSLSLFHSQPLIVISGIGLGLLKKQEKHKAGNSLASI